MSFCRWTSCAFLIAWLGFHSGRVSRAQVAAAQASAEQGVLGGAVADPSGAMVPHARLHIAGTGETAGVTRDLATDSAGRFSVTLPVGSYTVTVQFAGFRDYVATVRVAANTAVHVNLAFTTAIHMEELTVPVDTTPAADNAGALIFRGPELETFSSDDATFQKELLALAGSGKPPEVFINGFSGGRFPPKSSILSVRINRNQYSAAYENPSSGRVDITTKPGTGKLHGQMSVNATDDVLNAQNPYIAGTEPPYYLLNLDGNLTGGIDKKTSFFLAGTFNDQQNNAALNAITLSNNQPTAFSAAVRDPQLTNTFSLRVDRQFTPSNTLTSRYEFNQITQTNGGLTAPLTLPSQAFNSGTTNQTLQLIDTHIFGAHIVDESHFQYIRTRLRQDAVSNAPTLLVEGSFNGGGNAAQSLRDNQDHFEFQQALSVDRGVHYLRFGARYRLLREGNLSTANYNGQFIYPSLAAYQAGAASEYNLTAGLSGATLLTGDLAVYVEDEWKPTAAFTLDLGFRLESQSAIPDHLDPMPRVGAAWALRRKGQKTTSVMLRGGGGLFYDRFSSADILTSVRQNGLSQQTYTISNPTACTPFPACLNLAATQPTPYLIAPNFRSESGWIGGASVEKFLGKIGTASANYFAIRGVHQWVSRNINAPLPGTYNPSVPGSGVRPLGGSQNIYEFDSPGIQKSQTLYFNTRLNPTRKLTLYASYFLQRSNTDGNGAETFASNSYNLPQDFGRATGTQAQQLFTGGSLELPFGISANLFVSAQTGQPFNITTGTDLNGDTQYNDRPAFATAPTAASVVYRTRLGAFDANPQPGEAIIPINYGTAPSFVYVDLSASRSVKFGPRPPATAPASAAAGVPAADSKTPPPRADPPFSLSFTVDATNLLNHRNPGVPVGVLSSPLFGQSISLNGVFTPNTAANRVIFLQTTFAF
jgi:hypothetical protein